MNLIRVLTVEEHRNVKRIVDYSHPEVVDVEFHLLTSKNLNCKVCLLIKNHDF